MITSFQNIKIKEIKKLRERKEREETGLFLIEGYRELLRATQGRTTQSRPTQGKIKLHSLFFCEELFLKGNEYALIEKIKEDQNIPIYPCSKEVFEKISYRDRPDGLLIIAFQQRFFLEDLKKILEKTENPFLVIAEHIEKPGNLGTILRSCDGVRVDAVIVCDACTDIFNPNVVRASIGSLFTQPVIEAKIEELISFLKENQIKIVATTPHCKEFYCKVDLTGPVAIVVGSEQYGLCEKWLKKADIQVKIPMRGEADSLNVGAATTILLYETIRQRNLF